MEHGRQLPTRGSAACSTLAAFLAVHFTRTPLQRERIMFPETERVARYAGSREINSEVCAALDLAQYMLRQREFFTTDNAIRLAYST